MWAGDGFIKAPAHIGCGKAVLPNYWFSYLYVGAGERLWKSEKRKPPKLCFIKKQAAKIFVC